MRSFQEVVPLESLYMGSLRVPHLREAKVGLCAQYELLSEGQGFNPAVKLPEEQGASA